jgi:two-component system, sensor histidine kinase and response regulator
MKRILVVEDEDHLRESIADMLELEGFTPIQAENGEIAVQLARQHQPDLIICDIMMPELDGYGVLTQLHSDPATARIPFVFLTAMADRQPMRRGMDLGADDYLTKPFTINELLSTINTRLEKHARMTQEYAQKMDDLRENLISMLPHELRTPLTAIIGYSEMLSVNGDTLSGAQVTKMGSAIFRAGQRLYRLAENYLFYAQTELLTHDDARIDLLRRAREDHPAYVIRETAEREAARANRESDLALHLEDATVRIAPENLQKIVYELISNAVKFSDPRTPLHVQARAEEGVYRLRMQNHGRGMTAEQIQSIGAYMQFERKLYEQQGLGMGLILVRRLIDLYGGALYIDSTPDDTTTVTVELVLG